MNVQTLFYYILKIGFSITVFLKGDRGGFSITVD